jgi:glycerol uptake facilitator-like aquaporin
MNAAAARRILAEFIGTGLLVAIVVGSGIFATSLAGAQRRLSERWQGPSTDESS